MRNPCDIYNINNMSERVEKLIAEENAHILQMLHDDEAIYVHAYFYVDKDGKRVYDMDLIKQEFEENIETLIELNKQKGLAWADLN